MCSRTPEHIRTCTHPNTKTPTAINLKNQIEKSKK